MPKSYSNCWYWKAVRDNTVGLNTNPEALKQKVDQYLQDNALSHTQAMSSQATQLKQQLSAEKAVTDQALKQAETQLSRLEKDLLRAGYKVV